MIQQYDLEGIRAVCDAAPMAALSVNDTADYAQIIEEGNPVPVALVSNRENAEAFVMATHWILAILDQVESLQKQNEELRNELEIMRGVAITSRFGG